MENIQAERPYQVFVYGSLKRGEYNNPVLTAHAAMYCGDATTSNKYLLFGGIFPKLYRKEDMLPEHLMRYKRYLGRVRGELWRVDAPGLAALDALEGYPTHYTRRAVLVERNDKNVRQPWAYCIVRPPYTSSPLIEPAKDGTLAWHSTSAEKNNPFRERKVVSVKPGRR